MKNILWISSCVVILLTSFVQVSYADNCYLCSSGSSCGQYCRYSGSDTFDNRKKCEAAGCHVSGTASCPTAANYKVCSASIQTEKTLYFAINEKIKNK